MNFVRPVNLAFALSAIGIAGCSGASSTSGSGGDSATTTPSGDTAAPGDDGTPPIPDDAPAIMDADAGTSTMMPAGDTQPGMETTSPPPSPDGGNGTSGQSVIQRGNDIYKHASFIEPGLTSVAAATMAPDTAFNANATFPANGNTQNQGAASVLYVENGPAGAGCPAGAMGCTATTRAAGGGLFLAFPALGADPNIVAIDETSGQRVWTAHVATSGDGIRGTPVIDLMSRRLFVVTGPNPHLVHAVAVDTGAEITTGGWPVTLSNATIKYKAATFESGAQNQHGASLLMNNIMYIPFGGQYGDGGNYLGWIIALDITTPTRIAGWATQSPRSGIWGAGGLVGDGTYVYAVTGDTTGLGRNVSDSEEVVRVSGLAAFTRDSASIFVPTEWAGWDRPAGDLDFGASTPAFVFLPAGSTPSSFLVAPAKAGRLYVLDGTNLSAGKYPATGGALADMIVANTTSESVYTSPTIYSSASGLHATINVGDAPANCPAGTPVSKEMIISMLLQPGQTPVSKEVWCSPSAGGGHLNHPPISTTTDGRAGNPIVWHINGSQLSALDGDTGKTIVTTTGAPCNTVPSMSFPIAVKNRIVVSALGHLCSWSPNGK